MTTARGADGGENRSRPVELGRFDPFVPGFNADPYPVYARYRRADPVHYGVPPVPGVDGGWYLFRF